MKRFMETVLLINDKKTLYVVKTNYSDLFKIYVNVYPLFISFVSVKKKFNLANT